MAFSKNSQGSIVKVPAFDRDTWNKLANNNYVPELQKIVQLNAGQLNAFEGSYQSKDGDGDADDFLLITVMDKRLLLTQLWNQQKLDLWAVSPVEFFNEKQHFQ